MTDSTAPILIGLGANLPSDSFGPPKATIEAALVELGSRAAGPLRCSPFYQSAPFPLADQPDFVNAVAELCTDLAPYPLLEVLHAIEADFGRVRGRRNAARVLDLDLIAYGDRITAPTERPHLPHPRLHERAFVVLPLADLDPGWRHPRFALTAAEMSRRLPAGQRIRRLDDGG